MFSPQVLRIGEEGRLKMRVSVDFRQTTIVEPSTGGRFAYYISLVTDETIAQRMMSALKACISLCIINYTFELCDPALITKLLPVAELHITSKITEELLEITCTVRQDLQSAVQAYKL
jgi:hypothetical protein